MIFVQIFVRFCKHFNYINILGAYFRNYMLIFFFNTNMVTQIFIDILYWPKNTYEFKQSFHNISEDIHFVDLPKKCKFSCINLFCVQPFCFTIFLAFCSMRYFLQKCGFGRFFGKPQSKYPHFVPGTKIL